MKKIVVFFSILFITINIVCVNSYAKYVIEDTKIVANINIDGEIPKVELISINNSNEKYNKYANKTHTITIDFRVKEKNLKEDNIIDTIEFLLDDEKFVPTKKTISRRKSGIYIYYTVILYEISGNGELKIKIPGASVIDNANQVNEETIFDTGITIDNIAPVVNFSQEEIEDGKINAKIKANEEIREVNAWNLSEDSMSLSKEFECNVLYPFAVTDLAGNTTQIDVKINKATNIILRYGSLTDGALNYWEFGTGTNEAVGAKSTEIDSSDKIEAISLYSEGLDKDFIQIQSYIYTYWGEGICGLCRVYETSYNSGYNPDENEYESQSKGNIIRLEGYQTLLIGGIGMNQKGNRGLGGEAIPEEIAEQELFGISSLSIKLKDYTYYSVVYQAWVDGEGWLEPASDGEETTYAHDKPIGAYRMSLIPKTEKQYLIDFWKKDVGTNNMK